MSGRVTRSAMKTRGAETEEFVALSDFTAAKLRRSTKQGHQSAVQPLSETTNSQEPKALSFSPTKALVQAPPAAPEERTVSARAVTPIEEAAILQGPQMPQVTGDGNHATMHKATPTAPPAEQGELSDLEKLLAEPTPRLTPQTLAKMEHTKTAAAAGAEPSPADDRWPVDSRGMVPSPVPYSTEVPAVVPVAVKSKIVASDNFEPRSIRQLKREIKMKLFKQTSTDSQGASEEEEDGASTEPSSARQAAAAALSDALCGLSIAPLRGVPPAAGQHLRFCEDGAAVVSPVKAPQAALQKLAIQEPAQPPASEGSCEEVIEKSEEGPVQPVSPGGPLRGVPSAAGSHIRFED